MLKANKIEQKTKKYFCSIPMDQIDEILAINNNNNNFSLLLFVAKYQFRIQLLNKKSFFWKKRMNERNLIMIMIIIFRNIDDIHPFLEYILYGNFARVTHSAC